METSAGTSEFIAGLMGPLLLAVAAALVFDRTAYRRMLAEVANSTVTVFLAGAILFTASLAVVRVHNVWEGWPVLVTLLGWIGVIGGLARMLFAKDAVSVAKPFASSDKAIAITAAAIAVIGGYLTLKGYGLA
jgi:hypothetical protein